MDWFIITLASVFAGFVDAIVGGGGLILVPALFATFPDAAPASLFGTNKSASVWGTSFAAWGFSKRMDIYWRALWPALVLALIGSFLGAWAVTVISADFLRKLLPLVLLAVLLYTLAKKDLGAEHSRSLNARHERIALGLIGLTIGAYDGFFGPGTGSFLVFLLVRVLGYDFLHASGHAKLINVATNIAAILLFALKGHVWWHYTLVLALGNVVGSLLGTRMALKHGSGFVRIAFIVVVLALILKTGWDAFVK